METQQTAGEWARFAQTGSIYDYLHYKTQQQAAQGIEPYADCSDGPGSAPGQGGGSRPDFDDTDA